MEISVNSIPNCFNPFNKILYFSFIFMNRDRKLPDRNVNPTHPLGVKTKKSGFVRVQKNRKPY